MNRNLVGAARASLFALALAACANGVDPDGPPTSAAVVQDGIEYRVALAVLESFPVQLHADLVMRNRTSARAEVRLGSGCPVLLRTYRDAARTALAWDQGSVLACTKEIQIVSLPPGDTARRSARTDARAILGDSLPDGRYHLSVYVQVVGDPLLLPAGAVDLGVPR